MNKWTTPEMVALVEKATHHGGNVTAPSATLAAPDTKWRVMSSMQKAIRRGDPEHVLLTATALRNSGNEAHMMRRLCVTALEDIAFGDLDLVAAVLVYCGLKSVRTAMPEDTLTKLIYAIGNPAAHDRSPCELATIGTYGTAYALEADHLLSNDAAGNYDRLRSDGSDMTMDFLIRAALGGVLQEKGMSPESKSLHLWRESIEDFPPLLHLILTRAAASGGDLILLASAMATLAERDTNLHFGESPAWYQVQTEPLPPVTKVKGLYSTAFDTHCYEGKRAIAYYRKACSPIREHLEGIDPQKANAMLQDAVFEAEGKACVRRSWTHLGWHVDLGSIRSDADHHSVTEDYFRALMKLVLETLDELNYARAHVAS